MGALSPTSPGRCTTAERRLRALELRKAGRTFVQIGAELGISHQAANKLVKQALDDLAAAAHETAEDMRRLDLERLDAMHAGLWEAAANGKWLSVDRVLAIMERRAKLAGLDAPAKQQVLGDPDEPLTIVVRYEGLDGADGHADPT